ncbi:protein kinase family protein [Kitasatospora sp. LaBMicrA B282]|uniref:protein kinase family protein n=1 Tax=Kitasatospora sp. LaBMicrA B282 TaxID=3420949 RepID=UPI003D14F215
MADRTKDRAEAVVDRGAARHPARPPAKAAGPPAAGAPDETAGEATGEATGEITAPLSAAEIAAELADRPAPESSPEPGGIDGASAATQVLPAPGGAETTMELGAKPAGGTPDGDDDTADPADPADPRPEHLPVPDRALGDTIADRYRLEECISRSEVFSSWRAVDEKLRRAVGVHLLAAGSRRAAAVLAAARSAALLGDPRFVQVLDAVEEGELVYVIREWLPGATDLATLFADGPFTPYEAYQLVRQVSDAVAAAHQSGRAHLRLTPRCVLRTDTGQYRINGVAVDAALRGLPDQDAELADTRAIGTLLYAALTHRWPHPEDRYGLTGLPADSGLPAPMALRGDVHPGLAELAVRALGAPPPHRGTPIGSPAALAKEVAKLPRIRQPEQATAVLERPVPRYPAPDRAAADRGAAQRTQALRPVAPGHGHGPGHGHLTGVAPHLTGAPGPAPRRRPRRAVRVLKWTVSVVLLAAIGYGSWQVAGQLGAGSDKQVVGGGTASTSAAASTSPAPGPTPLPIRTIQSFNPFGSGPMHTNLLSQINSGAPGAAWSTDGYYQDLSTIGHGTGLLVDLGSAQPVGSVAVQFIGGTTAELHVPSAAGDTAPTQFSDFGAPVANGNGESVQFALGSPVTTRFLLIWLTSLPKDGSGSYRGQVSSIKVTG